MSIPVVIPTLNATPPALGAPSATPALNLATFLPADFANLLAQLGSTPSSAARSAEAVNPAHATTPSLVLETPSSAKQSAPSGDSETTEAVTEPSSGLVPVQQFLWTAQMPVVPLQTPVSTVAQDVPLCATQPVGANAVQTAPPGRQNTTPVLPEPQAKTNDTMLAVDAAPRPGGELKAQSKSIPATTIPFEADLESSSATGTTFVVRTNELAYTAPDRQPTIQGVLEALAIDPKDVISAKVGVPEVPAATDLPPQKPAIEMELPTIAPKIATPFESPSAMPVAAKTVFVSPATFERTEQAATAPAGVAASLSTPRLRPIEPLTDVPDMAAAVEAAFPTEHARSSDRAAATARPTTQSPEAEIAPVPAKSRTALGEGQDAGGADARSSSDAGRAPFGAQAPSPAHPVAKMAQAEAPTLSLNERLHVVQQVADRLETMRLTQGRQEVTLHLRPGHLGDLRLTITTNGADVTAQIVADSTAVRQSVDEGRDQLRLALEQKGYTLQGLDVSVNQGGSGTFAAFVPQNERPVYRGFGSRAQPQTETITPVVSTVTPRLSKSGLDYQA